MPRMIIATNTSSLSITTLASPLKHPERFVGMHFFNPVPLMRLVEVIDGVRTDPGVDSLMELGRRMTREPVRCKDAPGFLVNQAAADTILKRLTSIPNGLRTFPTSTTFSPKVRVWDGSRYVTRPDWIGRHTPRDGVDLPAVLRRAAVSS